MFDKAKGCNSKRVFSFFTDNNIPDYMSVRACQTLLVKHRLFS